MGDAKAVPTPAQKRAIQKYRSQLSRRGLARFEVLAPESDRELIRALARQLTESGPKAQEARAAVKKVVSGGPPRKGGIVAALRRSPLVGAELDISRPREYGRKIIL
jgi:hypothetical protein